MSKRLCVNLTCAKDQPSKACEALVVAIAAAACELETMLFLGAEGVRLSQAGYSDDIHEPGFSAMPELLSSLVRAGGRIWVCAPAFGGLGLDKTKLITGAELVGGGRLVEFLAGDTVCISY